MNKKKIILQKKNLIQLSWDSLNKPQKVLYIVEIMHMQFKIKMI